MGAADQMWMRILLSADGEDLAWGLLALVREWRVHTTWTRGRVIFGGCNASAVPSPRFPASNGARQAGTAPPIASRAAHRTSQNRPSRGPSRMDASLPEERERNARRWHGEHRTRRTHRADIDCPHPHTASGASGVPEPLAVADQQLLALPDVPGADVDGDAGLASVGSAVAELDVGAVGDAAVVVDEPRLVPARGSVDGDAAVAVEDDVVVAGGVALVLRVVDAEVVDDPRARRQRARREQPALAARRVRRRRDRPDAHQRRRRCRARARGAVQVQRGDRGARRSAGRERRTEHRRGEVGECARPVGRPGFAGGRHHGRRGGGDRG